MSQIREEFEKAFDKAFAFIERGDNTYYMGVAEWAAQWMAEKLAKKADEEIHIFGDEIRQLSKELSQ